MTCEDPGNGGFYRVFSEDQGFGITENSFLCPAGSPGLHPDGASVAWLREVTVGRGTDGLNVRVIDALAQMQSPYEIRDISFASVVTSPLLCSRSLAMTTCIGVWIDRRQAIVVKISGSEETCVHVESHVESQERRAADRTDGPYEPVQVPADTTRNRKESAELAKFYDEVISHFRNADAVYICGPGETRTQLKHHMAEHTGLTKNVQVEPSDRMTEPQLIAKIRQHFRD